VGVEQAGKRCGLREAGIAAHRHVNATCAVPASSPEAVSAATG
jgi:hypothetical protein